MATPIRVPGQWRKQHPFRISMGERTAKATRADDKLTIRKMGSELVAGPGGTKTPRYEIVEPLQRALIGYLKTRGVPEANRPQRVPIYLLHDDPLSNLSGGRALYGGHARPICSCSEWHEKQKLGESGWQTQDLPDPETVRDEMGNVPVEYLVGTATRSNGETHTVTCDPHTCPEAQAGGKCKYRLKMTMMLRDITGGQCPLADFVSTSLTTWQELHYWQCYIRNLTAPYFDGHPRLEGIPLWFVRGERPTTSPQGHKTIVPYAYLEFDGLPADAIKGRLVVGNELKQLAAGNLDAPANTAELAEFHPDIPVATAAEWQDRLEALLGRDGYRLSDSEIEHVVDHCQQHGDWEAVFTLYETEGPSASINGNPVPMVPEQEPEPLPEPEFDLPCDLAVLPTQKQAAKALKDAGWNADNLRFALALVEQKTLPDDDPDGLWRCIQAVHWYAEQNSLTNPFADLIADARMAEAEQAAMDFGEAEVG